MTSNQSNARVEIYTWVTCGYCLRAKQLLRDKNIIFIEHAIDGDDHARLQMMQRADGRCSMPQIFINDQGIGGFLELQQLENDGHLDDMLGSHVSMNKGGDPSDL